MSIEQKLKKEGSTLSKFDGRDPQQYNRISQLDPFNLYDSNLDLNGISPEKYDRQDRLSNSLSKSQLDLDGQVPKNNYRDNAPEGKSF